MQTFNSFANSSGQCPSSSNISHRPDGSKRFSLDNNAISFQHSATQLSTDHNVNGVGNNETAKLSDSKVNTSIEVVGNFSSDHDYILILIIIPLLLSAFFIFFISKNFFDHKMIEIR